MRPSLEGSQHMLTMKTSVVIVRAFFMCCLAQLRLESALVVIPQRDEMRDIDDYSTMPGKVCSCFADFVSWPLPSYSSSNRNMVFFWYSSSLQAHTICLFQGTQLCANRALSPKLKGGTPKKVYSTSLQLA